jgi:hypothetical protein
MIATAGSIAHATHSVEIASVPPSECSGATTRRREYMRRYQLDWMRRRKAQFFSGKNCDKCGAVDRLELHHRNASEKLTHNIWSWAPARRDAELSKCVPLCYDCHKKLTSLQAATYRTGPRFDFGASGILNVRWYEPRRRWRVSFEVQGRRVNVGGGGFRNIVTARLTAESFRLSLAKHYAKQTLSLNVACQKQLSLDLHQAS